MVEINSSCNSIQPIYVNFGGESGYSTFLEINEPEHNSNENSLSQTPKKFFLSLVYIGISWAATAVTS